MKSASPHLTQLNQLTHWLTLSSIVFTAGLAGVLASGCLFRPAAVSTRHFTLAPTVTNDPPPVTSEHLSIGIGFVKMPPYLLRSSMAVRNGGNEIEYFDGALWAERLDHSFQQTLGANLSRLLPADSIFLTDWGHDQVTARVFVDVQRFDVDIGGHGTLIAQWRITAPDTDTPLKIGHSDVARTGASPHGKPEVIAATLSDLTADFSRELAEGIRGTQVHRHARE